MKVILAKHAGFCMGVRRAVETTLETVRKEDNGISTFGPLIHNPQVLELLHLKGIDAISTPDESVKSTVVIRAHGIPPQAREELEKTCVSVCDATCPHVLRAQNTIRKHAAKGHHTVIVGDKGHAEVDGLLGCAGGKGFVISNPEEISSLPDGLEDVCVVAQTTQNRETFDNACEALKNRYRHVEIFNTICNATRDRQQEVRRIAEQVDAMIVVGGRNSANTARLVEIAQETSVKTYFVESEQELDLEEISQFGKVGVSAGASTPYWMIDRVVETLRSLPIRKRSTTYKAANEFLRFLVKGNIITALGAASMAYCSSMLMFSRAEPSLCLTAGTYALAMHIFNSYANRHATAFNEPHMAKFYERYGKILLGLGVLSGVLAIILAFSKAYSAFAVVALASVLGLLYCVPINAKIFWLGNISRVLRLIQGSKDLFTAAAWAVLCVFVPYMVMSGSGWRTLVITVGWAFTLVFIRSIVFDVKGLQGDSIMGKETIPIVLGKERTKLLLFAIFILQFAALVYGTFTGWIPDLGYWLPASMAYVCLYLALYHYRIVTRGLGFELLVDSSLIFPAILTFTWDKII